MKCKWCGIEVHLQIFREGGGMIIEDKTNKQHYCQPFVDWEKTKNLHGPTLSYSRYKLWLLGPKEAEKQIKLQQMTNKPLLSRSFFKSAHIVEITPEVIKKVVKNNKQKGD
jgi:hypothetical protein